MKIGTPPAISELKITVAEIEQGITTKNIMLNEKNRDYTRLIETRAQAKRAWKMAYLKKMMELTDTTVGVRKAHVEGDREVSKLEMTYEISLGIEKANLESMKDLQRGLDLH